MRVTMSNDVSNPSPCQKFTFGGVQDYTIHLGTLPKFVYMDELWIPNNPSGASTPMDNILVINGTAHLNDNTDVNNLTIMEGATLEVKNVLTLHGDLNIAGDLVFVSNENGNGELGPVSENSTIFGNATVHNYMSNKRSYRMVSSAVTTTSSIRENWQEGAKNNEHNPAPGFGTHITGSTVYQENGFDGTATGSPSMFTVNTLTQQFQEVPNTVQDILEAGNPYLLFIRGDRNINISHNDAKSETMLRATGKLFSGDYSETFETNGTGRFVMFGNPYQSAANINSVLENSRSFNDSQYYVYDQNKGDNGGYVTVTLPQGRNTDELVINQYLQPGQAAQVATLAAGQATVSFKESDKAPGNFLPNSATGNRLSSENMLTVQLYTSERFNNGGSNHDSFGIIFDDTYDNAITPADALKPMNFYENLGINHNGSYLSIERRRMPQPSEVYSLFSSGYNHLEYTLKMTIEGMEENFLYLDDNFNSESTLLQAGITIYSYGVENNNPSSIATDRFSIRTEEHLSVGDNSLLSGIHLFPNPIEDYSFYIYALELNGETVSISVSDMLGRQIFGTDKIFTKNTSHINFLQDLKSGVYTVTLQSNGETRSFKIIKR